MTNTSNENNTIDLASVRAAAERLIITEIEHDNKFFERHWSLTYNAEGWIAPSPEGRRVGLSVTLVDASLVALVDKINPAAATEFEEALTVASADDTDNYEENWGEYVAKKFPPISLIRFHDDSWRYRTNDSEEVFESQDGFYEFTVIDGWIVPSYLLESPSDIDRQQWLAIATRLNDIAKAEIVDLSLGEGCVA